ncbi:hypothetical protein GLOTRDRAFT_125111 [Gloeophyllum trabeum ATCC 11539]|uniref:N-acetyltransferase domain-containing protein n=1 Tax=Gloeophyllum trabeum (strain ATCC 11539 / FP-39264 / Madison 617) TaxID=670483 RepID=S7QFY2_GLOTA|nr:uncharacterized protein GLOTRDRAFT_125111 [Gloeophyllum trabeum ATCC 11539]EPQ58781.1 hypothetical protein GLOTRDRAFT_125111 [Gloeophyllum trabeum ATCC 11539]
MADALHKPYVRLAKLEELDRIAEMQRRAFIADPVFNYFGRVKATPDPSPPFPESPSQTTPTAPEGGLEELGGMMIWCPPHKRVSPSNVRALLRTGPLKPLKVWGPGGLWRFATTPIHSERVMKRGFKAHRATISPEDAWYLLLACTDPAHEGKGFMSLLTREAFAHAPGSVFTVEGSTAKSRDRYAHFGFTDIRPVVLGKGKVDERGYVAKGAAATGFTVYSQIKWK